MVNPVELARDLVGLNCVVVLPVFRMDQKIRPAQYHKGFGDAANLIERLFLDNDVVELWVGVISDHEKDFEKLIGGLVSKRLSSRVKYVEQGKPISKIILVS